MNEADKRPQGPFNNRFLALCLREIPPRTKYLIFVSLKAEVELVEVSYAALSPVSKSLFAVRCTVMHTCKLWQRSGENG